MCVRMSRLDSPQSISVCASVLIMAHSPVYCSFLVQNGHVCDCRLRKHASCMCNLHRGQ